MIFLDWWIRHGALGTKHAAIAVEWLKLAYVKGEAFLLLHRRERVTIGSRSEFCDVFPCDAQLGNEHVVHAYTLRRGAITSSVKRCIRSSVSESEGACSVSVICVSPPR